MEGLDGLGFDPDILNDIRSHFKKIQEESGVDIDDTDEYQKELEELNNIVGYCKWIPSIYDNIYY